ncbi:F-box domain protein [Pandoravirus inopinatum]|uniref:F-box domain protein n=1 Tax=Pandoravirus inopinatum TaxID=1605721 RepID=A0A0B5J6Q5_9VIRU|nr:F-box domain protein [Pandoravirus inopinatum]AJF97460.1 F-box domain protein [Pandoravirus inopinatum]
MLASCGAHACFGYCVPLDDYVLRLFLYAAHIGASATCSAMFFAIDLFFSLSTIGHEMAARPGRPPLGMILLPTRADPHHRIYRPVFCTADSTPTTRPLQIQKKEAKEEGEQRRKRKDEQSAS